MIFKKMKHIGLILAAMSASLVAEVTYAAFGTPTQYTVNLQRVEFRKVGGNYQTYRSGSADIDIASVASGEPCASLGPSSTLPPGAYDQFRFTVSTTFVVTGSVSNAGDGQPCRTVTGGAAILDPFGDGSVSVAYAGSADGGAAEPETVTVPTGSAVILPAELARVGNTIQGTFPVSFNVEGKIPQPNIQFNVANGVGFVTTGLGTCVVFPAAPSITASIG